MKTRRMYKTFTFYFQAILGMRHYELDLTGKGTCGTHSLYRGSLVSPQAASSGSPSAASRSGGCAAQGRACGAAASGSRTPPWTVREHTNTNVNWL